MSVILELDHVANGADPAFHPCCQGRTLNLELLCRSVNDQGLGVSSEGLTLMTRRLRTCVRQLKEQGSRRVFKCAMMREGRVEGRKEGRKERGKGSSSLRLERGEAARELLVRQYTKYEYQSQSNHKSFWLEAIIFTSFL